MNKAKKQILKIMFNSVKSSLALGLPWVPLYAAAQAGLIIAIEAVLKLIVLDVPRIPVQTLIPEEYASLIQFGQTLDRKDLAFTIPMAIIALGFIRFVSGFMSSYIIERGGHKAGENLRRESLKKFLDSQGHTLDKVNVDERANELFVSTNMLQSAVSKGVVNLIRDGFLIVVLLVMLLAIAWPYLHFLIPITIVYVFFMARVSKTITKWVGITLGKQVQFSTEFLRLKSMALSIYGMRSRSIENRRFEEKSKDYLEFQYKTLPLRVSFAQVMEMGIWLVLGAALYWKLNYPESFLQNWTTLLLILASMHKPLKNVAAFFGEYANIRVAWRKMVSHWESYADTDPDNGVTVDENLRYALEVKNITYKIQETPILEDINLKVPVGTRVAFIGSSGAGKTTCLRLCAGLLDPSYGGISVFSEPCFATQTPHIFRGTVSENIIYNNSSQDVRKDGNAVQKLILDLDLTGTETGANLVANRTLGYLGEGLSGGEKSRVALARVLFKNPKLLFLDEPTANLDKSSSKSFWESVDKWKAKNSDNTVIAVCHSLEEVMDWDQWYVFSDGKLVEQGTPQEFINGTKKGLPEESSFGK